MESRGDEENDFSDVINDLMNMFGNVMTKDVVSAVVESCDGDLNLSVDAIMKITSDGNVIPKEEDTAPSQQMASQHPKQPSTSYASTAQASTGRASTAHASAAHSTGAIPKNIPRPTQQIKSLWTDQIREIITNHNAGNRILVLMRGVPGSGKTHLAKKLVDMMIGSSSTDYSTHILSTDDYFMVSGQYQYDRNKLPLAHMWNHKRVTEATDMGVSPLIVDNTNVEMWEMEPYVRDGVRNGYIIEVVEPTTPWAKKAQQLLRKNTHNVPIGTIKRMLDNYQDNITGEVLRRYFKLTYQADMVLPVKRAIPAIRKAKHPESKPVTNVKECTTASQPPLSPTSILNVQKHTEITTDKLKEKNNEQTLTKNATNKENDKSETQEFFLDNEDSDLSSEEEERKKKYFLAQKKMEELERVEAEWENGENWDPDDRVSASVKSASITTTTLESVSEAKQQRKSPNVSPRASSLDYESTESIMKTVNDCHDWSQISMYMPPWVDTSKVSPYVANQEVPVEKISSGTCMEIGDTNVNGKNKVITATPRNINEFYISFDYEKIPQKRMLDKSSMTNEEVITGAYRCSNEEKHFVAFRKLFKNIPRSDLRDVFDKCCGDVNWSVEIVLDGMNNNEFKTIDTEESDPEEELSNDQCDCMAKYNIIPDASATNVEQTIYNTKDQNIPIATGDVTHQAIKKKREVISDENVNIKRQIEQNVVISDNHYSKHCLMIRKIRRGEPIERDVPEKLEDPHTLGASADNSAMDSNTVPLDYDISDDEDNSTDAGESEEEKIVTFNLGTTFIAELDKMYGREDMQYPDSIQPKISLPVSTLNIINALWMESLMFQLDDHAQKTAAMVEQDAEFARQIAQKEEELLLAGQEPRVPDLKEIMDMDIALAMYQKDIAEWRNSMPTDLAAKMTRDKLYNLFPDVDKDTLLELLMAHDNNFKATVEVLLMSTGRNEVLESENGVNKFVMEQEMKQKDKILQEQRKELLESEWPLLSGSQKVDMVTVESYRDEADQHLAYRNQNLQKAQDCIRRGMPQVATYYSDIAKFHKQKYEYANSLAVASLMQFHALNHPNCKMLDLHYFRVKEAKESLDIFIDSNISKLRDSGRQRSAMLFIITGRGNNSEGQRARIKPATMNRLKERGMRYTFVNPGLLSSRVNVDSKLTYQISVP